MLALALFHLSNSDLIDMNKTKTNVPNPIYIQSFKSYIDIHFNLILIEKVKFYNQDILLTNIA